MSANARYFVLALGGLITLAGLTGVLSGGDAWAALIIGLVILAGTLFDVGYRGAWGRASDPAGGWQRTGEREIDSLTGDPCEVWFDPASGARRYEPLGRDPNRD